MALLYGGLVLLVGVSLLITSVVLLNQSIGSLPFFRTAGKVTITDASGTRQVDPQPHRRHRAAVHGQDPGRSRRLPDEEGRSRRNNIPVAPDQ